MFTSNPPTGSWEPTSERSYKDSRTRILTCWRDRVTTGAPGSGTSYSLSHPFDDGLCCVLVQDEPEPSTCLLDCVETRMDRATGLTVLVSHPRCAHTGQGDCREAHEADQDFLERRGLWYQVSSGSWHPGRTSLLVVARVDVLDRTELPSGDGSNPPYSTPYPVYVEWETIYRTAQAEDAEFMRETLDDAVCFDREGSHKSAVEGFLECVKLYRSAGLHHEAQLLLLDTKMLMFRRQVDPDPEWDYRYFATEQDRAAIFATERELASVLTTKAGFAA